MKEANFREMVFDLGFEQGLVSHFPTDGDAVDHLQSTGWMKKHDKVCYEHGLEDAWRIAKWLNTANAEDIESVFGSVSEAYRLSASEALKKFHIRHGYPLCSHCENMECCPLDNSVESGISHCALYKLKEDDAIQVGDEVDFNGVNGIVTYIVKSSGLMTIMCDNGSLNEALPTQVVKTGKHYEKFDELLKQLRED